MAQPFCPGQLQLLSNPTRTPGHVYDVVKESADRGVGGLTANSNGSKRLVFR